MEAYCCDRCGKLYKPYKTNRNGETIIICSAYQSSISGRVTKELDICKDCADEFADWFNAKKREENKNE